MSRSWYSLIHKFSPVLAIVGFAVLYWQKGFNNLVPNLQGLAKNPMAQLQQNWSNIAIAIGAGIVIFVIHKMKLPAGVKAIVIALLFLVIGYEVGLFVDPPTTVGNVTRNIRIVRPPAGARPKI
jgi:hypothetical protein